MQWIIKHFDELDTHTLYAMLQLRCKVFIVEQNCPFQDMDDKDQQAYHLLGYDDKGLLVAYSRLLEPGISYAEASIGRVVSDTGARQKGYGKELMQRSIDTLYRLFGELPIRIGAQVYLQRFYEGFGFAATGDIYLEDNIEHIQMLRK